VVTDWDEALYAITASEMFHSGRWIGTTSFGALDYYNTKPPLNVWLITIAFKTFGPSLVSLRLASVASAWLTVFLLQWWARRAIGPAVALGASLVLATAFGFIHVHSGRSANTDALFTLLMLLVVLTLWAARTAPWRRVWLGPILAAVFLLRGMAVLMPLAIVGIEAALAIARRERRPWGPAFIALLLVSVPVGAWLTARWQLDQWLFLTRVVTYDFVARSLSTIEGHPGTPFYYLYLLQKLHLDWLFLGLVAWGVRPLRWSDLQGSGERSADRRALVGLVTAWAAATFLIPTLMQTKLPWYLNAFYPLFALAIAALVMRAAVVASRTRRAVLIAVAVLALGAAEGRLLWYSFQYRDLGASTQGWLLDERDGLAGRQVFGREWSDSEWFVLTALVGAEPRSDAGDVLDDFLIESRPGDYLMSAVDVARPELQLVRSNGTRWLYRRSD
jgi:4-amino-4-deoxy-L-arabinose transferase-like glycosyltransferase